MFDLVVIDEASQCNIASALPLLVRGKRALTIGDPEACLAHDNALRGLANYTLRLDATGFNSPLELGLHDALLKKGIAAQTECDNLPARDRTDPRAILPGRFCNLHRDHHCA